MPVLVANDADAAAFGEQPVDFPEARTLCLVEVSTGSGIVIVIGRGRAWWAVTTRRRG